MKLVCYGASVTAQKDKGGYFYHLKKTAQSIGFERIEKLAFGASHFDYAGFAFSQKLIEMKPDFCVIDWLTPSMREFSEEKIKALNNALLDANVTPIWVNFPRTDDLANERKCYSQVKSICEEHNINFWDISHEVKDLRLEPEKYLRDVVHTNQLGAETYARILQEKLNHMVKRGESNVIKRARVTNVIIPSVTELNGIIQLSNDIVFELEVGQIDKLEVLLGTVVGPKVCFLKAQLEKSGDIIATKEVNPAAPWCYYERDMILPPIKFSVSPGVYTLRFSYCEGNPVECITLRKPLNREDVINERSRMLKVSRLSVNAKLLTY